MFNTNDNKLFVCGGTLMFRIHQLHPIQWDNLPDKGESGK